MINFHKSGFGMDFDLLFLHFFVVMLFSDVFAYMVSAVKGGFARHLPGCLSMAFSQSVAHDLQYSPSRPSP